MFGPSVIHRERDIAVLSALAMPERPPTQDDPLSDALKTYFDGIQLKPWQAEAVDALLHKTRRALVVAPTGGGKSLCYQLPATILPGTALVICPLISLMEDQVRSLESRGIPATFVASSLPREENARRLASLRNGAYKLIYASPERLAFDGFLDVLAGNRLSLVAIDEAHCIVQWGHDFRPDYLRLGDVLRKLKPKHVIACTATATPEARAEILDKLGLSSDEVSTVLRGFARPNLHLHVREIASAKEALKLTVESIRESLRSPRDPNGAAIVYSATRKGTEKLALELGMLGWNARAYHAGLSPEVRAEVSGRFRDRKLSVVVATNAFGMGIDRGDVRLVMHAQPPSSIEAYYQEVGRAGRDGERANGFLLIAPADIALRRRLASMGSDGSPASTDEVQRSWSQFRELLKYVDADTCRHDFILRYFGDEAESLGGCGHCDVCGERTPSGSGENWKRDYEIARKTLAGVARARGEAGLTNVAGMLVGQSSERLSRLRFDRLSTYGVLSTYSHEQIARVLRWMLAAGWVDLTDSEYPLVQITSAGWKIMRGDEQPQFSFGRILARTSRRGKAAGSPAAPRKGLNTEAPQSSKGASGTSKKPPRKGKAPNELGDHDVSLFEELRKVRATLAKQKEVPAYVIASDRTLIDLCRVRPRTLGDLQAVYGMGEAKIAAFGSLFLDALRLTT